MTSVAASLGCRVIKVRPEDLPVGVRGACRHRTRAIFLKAFDYAPRNEFTIAHELLELHLPRSFSDILKPEAKEALCNRGAAALLLPRQQFLCSLASVHGDLAELRRRWPWASWAAIAARFVDLLPGAAAATWVNGEREWWRFSAHLDLGLIADGEHRARLQLRRRPRAVVRTGSLRTMAWKLVGRQGRRVALTVTVDRGGS